MSNLLTRPMQGILNLLQHLTHGLSSIQHPSSFLIILNKEFNLPLQILVKFLHLHNRQQYSIDLAIEPIMFSRQCTILFDESLSIEEASIEFSFGISEVFLLVL